MEPIATSAITNIATMVTLDGMDLYDQCINSITSIITKTRVSFILPMLLFRVFRMDKKQ